MASASSKALKTQIVEARSWLHRASSNLETHQPEHAPPCGTAHFMLVESTKANTHALDVLLLCQEASLQEGEEVGDVKKMLYRHVLTKTVDFSIRAILVILAFAAFGFAVWVLR